MAKTNTYSTIAEDLEWLNNKCSEIREFVDDNPYHLVADRLMVTKKYYDADGNVVAEDYKLVATIEQQHKSLRDSLKELAQIVEHLEKLRDRDEAKVEARGGAKVSALASKFLKEGK